MRTIKTDRIAIPQLGFGTFRMPGNDCQPVVESALDVGYRHIDTAEMYQNEAAVGAAIAASGIARDALFITTKVWHEHLAPDAIDRALSTSLENLRLDHVDLFMIHWPASDLDLGASLEAMMRLQEKGLTRAIGVCNFNMPLIKAAIEDVGAPIACHQVEYHPFLDQSAMLGYLREKNIPLVAYAPLAQGRAANDDVLAAVGRKYSATAAQIAIAWLLDQDNLVAIPKAQRRESQQLNFDAAAIRLDDEDRRVIAGLPKDQRFVVPPFAPDWNA